MAASNVYLVPIDFSKTSLTALDYAVRLARENKMELQLIHVIPAPPPLTMENGAADFLQDYYDPSEKSAVKQLKRLAQRKKLGSGKHRFVVIKRGEPARVIADHAKKSRASLIIMGSHGRTGLKRLMLGSIAERTLRYARCPVLIVKVGVGLWRRRAAANPSREKPMARVMTCVVPLDFSSS